MRTLLFRTSSEPLCEDLQDARPVSLDPTAPFSFMVQSAQRTRPYDSERSIETPRQARRHVSRSPSSSLPLSSAFEKKKAADIEKSLC
ncbi:hypothetical protein LshimejAT787_2600190 [Lyophyllum shimeji]|uniref:Uncharacterized protein n=1 Tax=Lyophyllum shimeji TaxID=47721 RepID=A0A9P3UX14_LYOSH|nr:hypothetical protein LshimejAT787_2600190 [Lyophyllum shimeji]